MYKTAAAVGHEVLRGALSWNRKEIGFLRMISAGVTFAVPQLFS
ncbi:hypothetical protein [Arthrobacter sp. MYb227]|nr:hypothetical protein [Arthrobacter sp. MYb227]